MPRVRYVLIVCFVIFGGLVFAQDTIPDPPEPFADTEPTISLPAENQEPDIFVPKMLTLNDRMQCDIRGISLEDITKGKVILRIYPANRVKVTDGISFIKRTPYLVLQPRELGEYNLIFILHRGEKLTFIEKHFAVTAKQFPEVTE